MIEHVRSTVTPLVIPPSPPSTSPQRRRWEAGEVTEIVAALGGLRTADIAHALGVHPKALRSALRRQGISLRAVREHAKRETRHERCGIVIRRPVNAPSATFGAAALEALPDRRCRWPSGDPAEPGFSFCGAESVTLRSYCAKHVFLSRAQEGDL